MEREPSSKNIDGIADLVVVAPIREGFIDAYENISYATRLRIVSEALNRVRVSAREREQITPFSDVTERILTLLDFRVGVIDEELMGMPAKARGGEGLRSRRFLYLTATFDGAWEPYMRLIWDPLGPFLDLLFCNCEGYVTAAEHSFDEYAQWVRDNQMDSAIFYATTGLTVRDHIYLNRLEQIQRAQPPAQAAQTIARLSMPQPEAAAEKERSNAVTERDAGNPAPYLKIIELGLEALTVLYRLADYFPPEWLTGQPTRGKDWAGKPLRLKEGHYLARAARDLLLGWDDLIPLPGQPAYALWTAIKGAYAEPLHWFDTGRAHLAKLDAARDQRRPPDPALDPNEVQGGILKPLGSADQPLRHGALLLMTITDAAQARQFIKDLDVQFGDAKAASPSDPFFRTIGFTADGLRRIGLDTGIIDRFPKEFREGMEVRAGLIGDLRENHPRDWILPERNWPPLPPNPSPFARARPPVEMSEVDIAVQIRTASEGPDGVMSEIARLARLGEQSGVALVSYEMMASEYDAGGAFIDHFGFHDGVSQPRPVEALVDSQRKTDEVRLGEVLLGYRNDRDDDAPLPFVSERGRAWRWRRELRAEARRCQKNGSFLVIRKLRQDVDAFESFVANEAKRINAAHPTLPKPMTPERLKALILGRNGDGTPLLPSGPGGANDFDYRNDAQGEGCPFAAHIRRTNPREPFQARRAPRILRRGMSYGPARGNGAAGERGMMFMAYNASIAEQFETIQRWINGGNSSGVASGHNDPLMGITPKSGALHPADRVFRFVEGGEVVRVTLPALPVRFVALQWGLYLFAPSRSALADLSSLTGSWRPLEESLETRGQAVLDRLRVLGEDEQQAEMKLLIEDYDIKDPALRNVTPDMWSAIRYYAGGSYSTEGMPFIPSHDWQNPPDRTEQRVVLSASYKHVMRVLTDWKQFTTEEQLRRIEGNSGPIYVTQQPDDKYYNTTLQQKYNYRQESEATNAILMRYDEEAGFGAGYAAAQKILDLYRSRAGARGYYKIELRRQFLLPALGELCKIWYGLPDGIHMQAAGWLWEPPAKRAAPQASCPGDFLSPSRNAFYPRPSDIVDFFADAHGKAILAASTAFVEKHRLEGNGAHTGSVAREMFAAIAKNDVLARNLIGTMVGAIPPMDGNLRGILLEWLTERTLWRHQSALRRMLGDTPAFADFAKARAVLFGPISQAMCKRPAPDLLYRTATDYEKQTGKPIILRADSANRELDVHLREGDLVVASLVSAAQRSLAHKSTPDGDVSIVFGGKRRAAWQPARNNIDYPVHACPARDMAMGAIVGIMAALLDAGRIQALPASLIVRISDWPKPAPGPV